MFQYLRSLGPKTVTMIEANYNKEKQVMTLEFSDGKKEEFKGDEHFWFKMPLMKEPAPGIDSELHRYWKYIGHYGNPYPNAHENNHHTITHTNNKPATSKSLVSS